MLIVGLPCIQWDTIDKQYAYTSGYFPEKDITKAENYCRNPTDSRNGPWCYTNVDGTKEECNIPLCGKDF